MDKKIGFIGCGNMGKAILGGIINSGKIALDNIFVSIRSKESKLRIEDEFNVKTSLDNNEVTAFSDILFLAVKPNMFKDVLNEIKDNINKDTLVISIAAGVTVKDIEDILGTDKKIVRTMPNTQL